MKMSEKRSSTGCSLDDPPNSRLFIIGPKSLTEQDFRNAFHEFGQIEEVWVVKDRHTGENKGVTYIKYSRTSEAARALEAMNGKQIGGLNRSIRVMIAATREQGSKKEENEEEKTLRLFVMVPKSMTDTELYNIFKEYGDIDYCSIIKDKESQRNKGFAYVKYYKFSHAAAAFENCDRKFKPVFAEPRKSRDRLLEERGNFPQSNNSYSEPLNSGGSHVFSSRDTQNNENYISSYTRLTAIVSPNLNQDQVWKLFDIVPGLDYCSVRYEGRLRSMRGIASVVYTSHQWASYARDKLHGFEYPPGNRIIIKPDYNSAFVGGGNNNINNNNNSGDVNSGRPPIPPFERNNKQPDILQIAETIAQASNLIQAAGLSPDIFQNKLGFIGGGGSGGSSSHREPHCSVPLPEPQPFADIDEPMAARCFIVCTPTPLPNSILKDIFCRFGNLIDVYMLPNRNCGYAKYARKESAERAINVLHGADISGIRIKVLEAQERDDVGKVAKRQRVD